MRKFTVEMLWENKNYFLDKINAMKKTPVQPFTVENTIKNGLKRINR